MQEGLIQRVRSSTQDTLRAGLSRVPAKWLRELLAHDAEAHMARIAVPVLCISGGKDIQCDPLDGHRIARVAKGPVEVHLVPDLTQSCAATTSPSVRYSAMRLSQGPWIERQINLTRDRILRQA